MARRVAPVRPRRKDERRYIAELRAGYVAPLGREIDRAIGNPNPESVLLDVEQMRDPIPPAVTIEAFFLYLNDYHERRTVQTFWSALRVDVSGDVIRGLHDEVFNPRLRAELRRRIQENVNLIGNQTFRTRSRLRRRILTSIMDSPRFREGTMPASEFRARVFRAVEKEKRVTMSDVRRIAEDQTRTAVATLTRMRHESLGITTYRWITQGDDRVRPTHAANGGNLFEWRNPPATGHPGQAILCRCVAQAVPPPDWREGL